MYNYLASFIWKQEEELEQADEKVKRAKYLVGEQIKKSNFKLRITKTSEPEKKLKKKLTTRIKPNKDFLYFYKHPEIPGLL